jgi:hypothetical protein
MSAGAGTPKTTQRVFQRDSNHQAVLPVPRVMDTAERLRFYLQRWLDCKHFTLQAEVFNSPIGRYAGEKTVVKKEIRMKISPFGLLHYSIPALILY